MSDWSLLPNDLLELIVGHFDSSFQIVLLRSVCSSWRSVVPPRCLGIKTHNIPFRAGLWFNCEPYPYDYDMDCTLKKISVYLVRFKTPFGDDYLLTEMREREFGKPMVMQSPLSSNSITYETRIHEMVFNSLTSQIIPFGQYYEITYDDRKYSRSYRYPYGIDWEETSERVEYLQLQSENCRDFVVLAGGRSILVMYRSRNMSWTHIADNTYYQDMIAFKGKFYAVDSSGWGHVFVIEPSSEINEIPSVRRSFERSSKERLVQSGEELLLVQWFESGYLHGEEIYRWFRVFRLDEGGSRKWVQVDDLNDRVIFLGSRTNLCCSVQMLPGAKENCIVFIDWSEGVYMFDLRTRRTSLAFNECKGYMGAFGANLESLVSCGVVTMPDPDKLL